MYQSKLHTLRNPMMYTLLMFESEAARSRTKHLQNMHWWTCGIEREAMEKKTEQQKITYSNRSWNIYGWHYWNRPKNHDTRLFNSQWNALKRRPSQIVIIFQSTVFNYGLNLRFTDLALAFPLTINNEPQFEDDFATGSIPTLTLTFYWLLKSLVSWSTGWFQ